MNIKQEMMIEKDIDAVWAVMGGQFAQVHLWSSNFFDSKPGGSAKFTGLDYSTRDTITDRGQTIQELDTFDPTNYALTYHVTKGVPKIANRAVGLWSLKSIDENKTTVVIAFILEPKGIIGFLLTPIIKLKIQKASLEIAEELKYYLEQGKAHPRNQAI